ncbi:MAG: UPF0175 family protein [Prosthecobacter sp.]|jgi:predicted HTH domain antitoxin|nr:UPF0175 family protein [Prosthecobacter sp.]
MTITIPDTIAQEAGLDEKEALKEFAFALYAQGRITGGQLRQMCGLGYVEFFDSALARGLPTCAWTDEEGAREIENLKKLGWL